MTKPATAYQPRLKQLYRDKLAKELKEELGLSNIHQAPRLEKIVISVGVGRAKDEKRLLEVVANTLTKVTGQKPVENAARKSIASFKLRQGVKIGLMTTLRGDRMYEFADRFINIILPRLRDFHGVSNGSFDKQGNYNIGLSDQSVFPELSYEDTASSHGLQVIFVIKSRSADHAKALLEKLGMPFERSAKPSDSQEVPNG